MKRLIVFDLDGTLAKSKSSLDDEMAQLLRNLLSIIRVAVISGGDWPQFQTQLISNLPEGADLGNMSILPTCGTKFYQYDGAWKLLYAENFTPEEKQKIIAALQHATAGLGIEKTWGEQIEDRGSQITFSALGQQAPLEEKSKWDPDFAKRQKIKAQVDSDISGYSVRLGGTTSVDVTRPGIDKAYGIEKLAEILSIMKDEMLFIGDAVFPGGNDYPAKQAGVTTIQVRDPEETKRVVEAIIASLPCDGARR